MTADKNVDPEKSRADDSCDDDIRKSSETESCDEDAQEMTEAKLRENFDSLKTRAEELEQSLQALEKERDEYRSVAARAQADLFNFRKRVERDRQKQLKLAVEDSVMTMLPVLDNLDRALDASGCNDVSTVVEGVQMVQKQFLKALNDLGAKVVVSIGQPFSPAFHEAVGMVDVDNEGEDGMVVEEFTRGYQLAEKVIRPARVRVGRYKPSEE